MEWLTPELIQMFMKGGAASIVFVWGLSYARHEWLIKTSQRDILSLKDSSLERLTRLEDSQKELVDELKHVGLKIERLCVILEKS